MKTRKITITAVILAICLVSQFFKNTSVFITGSIVNTCLIIATLKVGIISGVTLSIITPITSFIITGSPIMGAVPAIIPMIMIGNAILVLCTGLFCKSFGKRILLPMVIGSILKGVFMGITIGLIILPMFLPKAMQANIKIFQYTFSVVQVITAIIGSFLARLIWIPLSKVK